MSADECGGGERQTLDRAEHEYDISGMAVGVQSRPAYVAMVLAGGRVLEGHYDGKK